MAPYYGSSKYSLTPALKAERRALLTTSSLTMFLPAAFPNDFQPTAACRAVLAALYPPLPPNAPIPPLPAGAPEQKRELLSMAIFGHNCFLEADRFIPLRRRWEQQNRIKSRERKEKGKERKGREYSLIFR